MEINEQDLRIEVCGRCKGERRVWEPDKSIRATYREQVECPDCRGRGLRLTPIGEKLFDFVQEAVRLGRH